jgi:cell division protein FtsQ
MSRTVKRQPASGVRRPAPRARQPVKKVSPLDRLVAALPVSEGTLHRITTWTITGAGVAVALVAASWIGVPGMIGNAVAEGASRAGFRVEQIEITGLHRMDRMSVYAVALDQKSTAMTQLDLEAVRQKLLRYGWIADAHVSRRLPDTLLVDIVERQPAAVWQDNGNLTLIDKDGVALEPVRAEAMPDLPLVIGPGADREEPGYQTLLAAAPTLRRHVKAATWVGNRRWDLTFTSGETLALPEDGAAEALGRFAGMNDARPLLGRGWLRFDLRDPTRLVARKPGADLARRIEDDGRTPPATNAPMASGSPTPHAATEG